MNKDFLILGAGSLGLATAEALLQQGASVTVLERGAVGQESSWAGGGILSPLCPWDYPDVVTCLTSRGAGLFADWSERLFQATGIDPEYEPNGMLVLPPFDKEQARNWCGKHGMKFEEVDGGLLLPEIAQVRNPRLLKAQRARVVQLGGRIVEQCVVRNLTTIRDAISKLETSSGEFQADNYIVTAGAWSKQLLDEQALQLDIKPIRGQMLLFKFDSPPMPHIVLQNDLYLIPRRDGHLLVGSTLEDVGFDKTTSIAAREMLLQRALTLLPVLSEMQIVKHWAGLRPGSPDNIPTIGRHSYMRNLYINSGHFRYGVTMAPASVEMLLNEIEGISLSACKSSGTSLDAAAYRWL